MKRLLYMDIGEPKVRELILKLAERMASDNMPTPILVGAEGVIVKGACAGITGMVIYADSVDNSVILKADQDTYIACTFQAVSQEIPTERREEELIEC